MSIKKVAKDQPESFEFNASKFKSANDIIKNYPSGKQQSAVMSFLYLAQRQNNNWIPLVAMKYIAKLLNMPYIKVYEVATFYPCIIYHQLVNILYRYVLLRHV